MSSEIEPLLSIGALAGRTGVSVDTIRYYERIGLLAPSSRTGGRHRLYTRRELGILNFVRRGRELGFSLGDIRALLALGDAGSACRRAKQIADRHLAKIRDQVASLTKLEQALSAMADRCHPEVRSGCPIIEALSSDCSAR